MSLFNVGDKVRIATEEELMQFAVPHVEQIEHSEDEDGDENRLYRQIYYSFWNGTEQCCGHMLDAGGCTATIVCVENGNKYVLHLDEDAKEKIPARYTDFDKFTEDLEDYYFEGWMLDKVDDEQLIQSINIDSLF